MNMKRLSALAAILAFAIIGSALAFAAGGQGADRAILLGEWKVIQGLYSDGSVEKELDMGFSFTETTLSNPMDGSILTYAIDEKAKTISASGASSSIVIVYKVIDRKTVEFLAMTVTSKGKPTAIVGKDAMFSSLRLGKK